MSQSKLLWVGVGVDPARRLRELIWPDARSNVAHKYTLQQCCSGVLHGEDACVRDHENDYTIILFSQGLQTSVKIA